MPALHQLTQEAREKAAKALFGLEDVRGALIRTAVLGLATIRIRPNLPIDLRSTAAARKLVKHLEKEGLVTFWHLYGVELEGRRVEGFELEISWPVTEPLPAPSESEPLAAD